VTAGAPAAPVTRAGHAPVLVVLPALNEAESIARVVDEVRRNQPDADLLVVDDGSTDRTAEIARSAGARVMSLPFNLGIGGAMRAAYRFAFEEGYDCVVQVDADGQHDPSDIARLRAALEHADVVVGARFAGVGEYVVRGPRRWAMRLLAATLSWLVGTPLTDPTSGGVSASLAMLGDINIAEPKAYIGFAGTRVAQQTVREPLPEGFQRSEFQLEHGAIDVIVDRRDMRDMIAALLNLFMKRPALQS